MIPIDELNKGVKPIMFRVHNIYSKNITKKNSLGGLQYNEKHTSLVI